MDLLCYENSNSNEVKAYEDPVLLQERVLTNMLKTEDQYTLTSRTFPVAQNEVTEAMVKVVAEWMMEVCEEQKCQEEVFTLAMNYMNRFLVVCRIKKNQLQLLGTACMLIASKLREARPLRAEKLVFYTDHSITIQELWGWELLVLSKLKWDMAAVTPQDFLRHILGRIPVADVGIEYSMVDAHAKTLIALCAREFRFSWYNPSIIACASIASALCGVGWERKSGKTLQDLLQTMHKITTIEKDFIEQCCIQIDSMLREATTACFGEESSSNQEPMTSDQLRPDEFTPPPKSGKLEELETAVTPTDVRDVRF